MRPAVYALAFVDERWFYVLAFVDQRCHQRQSSYVQCTVEYTTVLIGFSTQ